MAAWKEACQSTGRAHITIPKGTYIIGPLKFSGPCLNVSSLTIRVKARLVFMISICYIFYIIASTIKTFADSFEK